MVLAFIASGCRMVVLLLILKKTRKGNIIISPIVQNLALRARARACIILRRRLYTISLHMFEQLQHNVLCALQGYSNKKKGVNMHKCQEKAHKRQGRSL